MSSATYVVYFLKELNYNCTFDVKCYKEIFSLFSSLTNFDIIQIIGMVAHTYKGSKYLQGTHEKKFTTLCTCITTFLCVVDSINTNVQWVVMVAHQCYLRWRWWSNILWTTLIILWLQFCCITFKMFLWRFIYFNLMSSYLKLFFHVVVWWFLSFFFNMMSFHILGLPPVV